MRISSFLACLASALLVLALALAGCGPSEEPASEPAQDAAAPPAAESVDPEAEEESGDEVSQEDGGETGAPIGVGDTSDAADAPAPEPETALDAREADADTSADTSSLLADAASTSREAYEAVETGMSYEQVVDALGAEGTEIMRMAMFDSESATYAWRLDGASGDVVALTFMDGALLSKMIQGAAAMEMAGSVQDRLPEGVQGAVTMAQYEQLETGMPYERVVELLGAEGTEFYEMDLGGTGGSAYTWKGAASPSAILTAVFQDGALVTKMQVGLE